MTNETEPTRDSPEIPEDLKVEYKLSLEIEGEGDSSTDGRHWKRRRQLIDRITELQSLLDKNEEGNKRMNERIAELEAHRQNYADYMSETEPMRDAPIPYDLQNQYGWLKNGGEDRNGFTAQNLLCSGEIREKISFIERLAKSDDNLRAANQRIAELEHLNRDASEMHRQQMDLARRSAVEDVARARREALEEAAKVCDLYPGEFRDYREYSAETSDELAARIRALSGPAQPGEEG